MKPTPSPWHINPKTSLVVKSGEDNTVCSTGGASSISLQEHQANAAHIVKCVNMHDELLEALKSAEGYIRELGTKTRSLSTQLRHDDFLRDNIEEVLEKALTEEEREQIAQINARLSK